MRRWPVQDAKARFSMLLETCLRKGCRIIRRRDADAAVLGPLNDWQRALHAARPTLKALLLSSEVGSALDEPPRGGKRRRQPRAFT